MHRLSARLLVSLGLAAAAAAWMGCTGSIGDKGAGSSGGSSNGTPGGGPGSTNPPDISGPRTEALCTTPATPRPVYLRRLTNSEYSHTVSDLLGVTVDAETQFSLPTDTSAGGFSNNAENGTISTAHVQAYGAAAAQLVSDLMASSTRRLAVVGCDMTAAATRASTRSCASSAAAPTAAPCAPTRSRV
jgi:hypothetical protein